MPAEIDSIMYAGEMPWHKIGTHVGDSPVKSDVAIKRAKLDWDVGLWRPYVVDDKGELIECENNWAVVREDTDSVLSIVGNRYEPVQNTDAFSFFDEVIGKKTAMYEVAGSLDGGKKIWILAKLPQKTIVKIGKHKDVTNQYLLFASSHDGTGSVRMLYTPIRVVCMNTLTIALKGAGTSGISIRHTGSVHDKLDEAQKTLSLAKDYYDDFGEVAQAMANASFGEKKLTSLVRELVPTKDEDDVPGKTLGIRDKILSIHESGMGLDNFRGTGWGFFNAVAEYADHNKTVKGDKIRKDNSENRLDSIWFGSGAALKRRAFDLVQKRVLTSV